jgi:hypothetical protein
MFARFVATNPAPALIVCTHINIGLPEIFTATSIRGRVAITTPEVEGLLVAGAEQCSVPAAGRLLLGQSTTP